MDKPYECITSFQYGIEVGNRQELVRCRDCKYEHKTYDGDCKYCDMFTDDDGNPVERYRSGDWFCADGKYKIADEILMEEMDADPLG